MHAEETFERRTVASPLAPYEFFESTSGKQAAIIESRGGGTRNAQKKKKKKRTEESYVLCRIIKRVGYVNEEMTGERVKRGSIADD